MKKFLSLLLALTFVLIFAACGNQKGPSSETDTSTTRNATGSANIDTTESGTAGENPLDTNASGSGKSTTITDTGDSIISTKGSKMSSQPNTATSTSSASKPTTNTNNTSVHTHVYSKATCTEPQKCSCGALKGVALGHTWEAATCKAPKTCSVCKITEGAVGEHIIKNGLCKFCDYPIVVSPKNLDLTNFRYYRFIDVIGDYKYWTSEHESVLITDVITSNLLVLGLGSGSIGNEGVLSSNIVDQTALDVKINYEGKIYYGIGGGVYSGITYELTDQDIIIRLKYEPDEYAKLNLLSDDSLKVVFKTDGFYGNWNTQVGWIYTPTTQLLY